VLRVAQEGVDWARAVQKGDADEFRVSSPCVLLSLAICGDYICSGAVDHTIRVWERDSLQPGPILAGHCGPVGALSVWGTWLLSGGTEGSLRAWDVKASRCMHTWRSAHRDAIRDLASTTARNGDSDDGLLISVCDRGSVLLWHLGSVTAEPSTWRCVKQLAGHSSAVSGAIFFAGDNSSTRAATCSYDNDVRIWEINPAAVVGASDSATGMRSRISGDPAVCSTCLYCRSSVSSITWGDGLLFTASEDRAIRAWTEIPVSSTNVPANLPRDATKQWSCVRRLLVSGTMQPWRMAWCAGRILVSATGEPPAARRELLVLGPQPIGPTTFGDTEIVSSPEAIAAAGAAGRVMGAIEWRLPQVAGGTVSAVREGTAGEAWAAIGRELVVWGRG
jgi:WD40 repeat protein